MDENLKNEAVNEATAAAKSAENAAEETVKEASESVEAAAEAVSEEAASAGEKAEETAEKTIGETTQEAASGEEELTPEELAARDKAARQSQFGIIIRGVVGGYVAYLGYSSIRGMLADETTQNSVWLFVLGGFLIVAGIALVILTIYQLIKLQGIKNKLEDAEREAQGQPKKDRYIPFISDFKEAGSNMKRTGDMLKTGMTPEEQKAAEAEAKKAEAAGETASVTAKTAAGQNAARQTQTAHGSGADIMARLRAMNEADGLELSDEEE